MLSTEITVRLAGSTTGAVEAPVVPSELNDKSTWGDIYNYFKYNLRYQNVKSDLALRLVRKEFPSNGSNFLEFTLPSGSSIRFYEASPADRSYLIHMKPVD